MLPISVFILIVIIAVGSYAIGYYSNYTNSKGN